MVVRIRLQRFGRTHSPFYRMVAAHAKAPRDGRFLEILGTYNPIATMKKKLMKKNVTAPGVANVLKLQRKEQGLNPNEDSVKGKDNYYEDRVKEVRLKVDRLQYWISVGAQPSDRVAWILGKFGILPPPPRRFSPDKMIPKKDRKKKED